MAAITAEVVEIMSKELANGDEQPPLFDGTTRLYTNSLCPFAQRVWIARNYKGLQDKIQLVPINLQSKPAWYSETVYAPGKVPSLEHNGKVIGESIDLIKYLDANFEGPALFPEDKAKQEFAEVLLLYADSFWGTIYGSLKEPNVAAAAGPTSDYLETALSKFNDGPFFLGQFSMVDIAYMPLIERLQPWLKEGHNFDITAGRPKLAAFIQEMDKIEAYKQTKADSDRVLQYFRTRFPVK